MARVERSEDVRARLVAEACRALEQDGPSALNARRLTSAIGTSTTAVYHYFGGMPALLRAVADDGFARLNRRLAAVPVTDDAITDIAALALAYRAAAVHGPHLYDLMFGLSAPGGQRPEPSITVTSATAATAFAHLIHAVSRAIEQGRLHRIEPVEAAAQLWSMVHGYVGLELAGLFGDHPAPVRTVLLPLGRNLIIGLGDDPHRASLSAAAALTVATS